MHAQSVKASMPVSQLACQRDNCGTWQADKQQCNTDIIIERSHLAGSVQRRCSEMYVCLQKAAEQQGGGCHV